VGTPALPVFLVALGAEVWDSQLGLLVEKSSKFGWPAAGKGLLHGFFVGVTQTARVCREGKTGLGLGDLKNSLFRFCIWHSGRLPSLIYYTSKS